MSSRPAHQRNAEETYHASQVQAHAHVRQPTPMRGRSISSPLLISSRIGSERGDRKPRRAKNITLHAVFSIVEPKLNFPLEKPFVFDKRVFVE